MSNGNGMICKKCKSTAFGIESTLFVCPNCGYHFRMPARERLKYIADSGSINELFLGEIFYNPLNFPGYEEKYDKAKIVSGENEGVICAKCKIGGIDSCIFVMEPDFMMGTMGAVVGEKITLLFEYATKKELPVIGFSVSGGARMQEGIYSLMQMAKVVGAVRRHSDKGLFFLSFATDPTMGGVTASFLFSGDMTVAEPGAQIGFAGKRVVENFERKPIYDDFRSAEKIIEYGLIDAIVDRKVQREFIANMLKMHTLKVNYSVENMNISQYVPMPTLSAYERVKIARKNTRATCIDYIENIFEGFFEFHGDGTGEDSAVVGGLAYLQNKPVVVVGTERGRTTEERIERNFGMANPSGYGKALKLMRHAEKFRMPVVFFVDIQGAKCDRAAEEGGISRAIADNIYAAGGLATPIISVIIGEAGSGGALGFAVSDRLIMLENAYYSVSTPEACSSILGTDKLTPEQAAASMKVTSEEVFLAGVADRVVPEPDDFTDSAKKEKLMTLLKRVITEEIAVLSQKKVENLLSERYEKYRKTGRVPLV